MIKMLGGFVGFSGNGGFGNAMKNLFSGKSFYQERKEWTIGQTTNKYLSSIDQNVAAIARGEKGGSTAKISQKTNQKLEEAMGLKKDYDTKIKQLSESKAKANQAMVQAFREGDAELGGALSNNVSTLDNDINLLQNSKEYKKAAKLVAKEEKRKLRQEKNANSTLGTRAVTGVASGIMAGMTATTQMTKDGETYAMSDGMA